MSNLAHDTTNDTRLSDFMSVVHELGREAASGKDSLPNLAISFVRAVADGVIDMSKDASGDDGAARVFKAYATAEGKKAIHDRTENGLKANVSKLRQLGNFAGNPKWDAVDVLNRAIVVRNTARDDELDVKPAYAAFVDVAREQLKHDDALSDDMLRDVVLKSINSREVTLEGELKKIAKHLENVISGEKWPGVQDQSPEVLAAAEQINARLAAMMTKAQHTEAMKKAYAAGIITEEQYVELKAAA